MNGKHVFKFEFDVLSVVDSGMALDDILAQRRTIPSQGVRVDVAFSGSVVGEIQGRVEGVDYIQIRSDGAIRLDIRSIITTESNERIALRADGAAILRSDRTVADLFENITLTTTSVHYAWLNSRQCWGSGYVDFKTGKIVIDVFAQ